MNLTDIKAIPVERRKKIRVGRGRGSGKGKTCGRGNNGQLSRSGKVPTSLYEGGQMPLFRRLPRRGFNNRRFARTYAVVNLAALNRFEDGQEVDPAVLLRSGLVARLDDGVKILAGGDLHRRLTVKAHHFSRAAAEKIQGAGGTVVELS